MHPLTRLSPAAMAAYLLRSRCTAKHLLALVLVVTSVTGSIILLMNASKRHSLSSRDAEAQRSHSAVQPTTRRIPEIGSSGSLSAASEADPATKARINESYGKLPLSFEANAGQADSQVKFFSRGSGYGLYLTQTEAVLALNKPSAQNINKKLRYTDPETEAEAETVSPRTAVLRIQLHRANPTPQVAGTDELPGKVSYFIGNDPAKWQANISTYTKVHYQNVYEGVDLIYYGNQRQLEYDFKVAPGADPDVIRLAFKGVSRMRVDQQGDLVLSTEGGEVRQHKPVAYQEIDGIRQEIASRYVLKGKHQVGLQVGDYDADRPLIIDPVLIYSTYLGGDSYDFGESIAVDQSGNAYVTGLTYSTNFPTTSPLQPNIGGNNDYYPDAFVTKLNASGSARVYSTYLGGTDYEESNSIAVDGDGNAYVTGYTYSNNFPAVNPYQPTPGAPYRTPDCFVAKLNASGSALVYSTYIGGDGLDIARSIAVDGEGSAYLTGYTTSSNFPTASPLQAARSGSPFFRSTDSASTWNVSSTGLTASIVNAIIFDPSTPTTLYAGTNIGVYKSADAGITWTASPGNASMGDAYVLSLAIDPITPSTLYAGTQSNGLFKSADGGNTWTAISSILDSYIGALAIDPATPTTIYAGARTTVYKSTNGGESWNSINYGLNNRAVLFLAVNPTTPSTVYACTSGGFYKSTNGGGTWTSNNTGLSYSPYVYSVAIDPTNTSTLYLATRSGIYKSTNGGNNWNYSSTGLTSLSVRAVAIDPVAPSTLYAGTNGGGVFKSTDGGSNWSPSNTGLTNTFIYALAVNPANTSTIYAGTHLGRDAFITKLNAAGSALVYSTYYGGNEGDGGYGIAVDANGNAYVTGDTSSLNLPIVNPIQGVKSIGSDVFISKLNAGGSAFIYATYLGGNSSDYGSSIALDSAGNAYVTGYTYSTNFPTANAFQSTNKGGYDAFVIKLNGIGSELVYSTYLGGDRDDRGNSIAVDNTGNAYIAGFTYSFNFPAVSSISSASNGDADAFVSKLNGVGSALVYSTYLGGYDYDEATGIALDGAGNAYVAGYTFSTNFPVASPMQATSAGYGEAFILKLAPAPDLVVTMTDTPDPVVYGSNLTYTINVTNSGEIAATNVTLTDTLPTGSGFVSASPSQGTCSGTSTITCNLGTLNTGAVATVTIVITPPQVRNITNSASVSASEPESMANNTATQSTLVDFTDLSITNTTALQIVEIGAQNTYIVTVKNNGPATAASVVITNNLPSEMTFVSCTAIGGGVCGGSGNNRTATFSSLGVGGSATVTFVAAVNDTVPAGTVISDTASVSSPTPDINPNNNSATTTLTTRSANPMPRRNGLIAFTSGRGDGTSGTSDIYLMNPDGTGTTNITYDLQEDFSPVWSPDGTKIAYISRGTNTGDGIYVMNADGSNKTRLTDSYYDQSPTWSPDGTRIAFASNRVSGSYSIYVMNSRDGSGLRRMASVSGNNPAWSPDGARIAYNSSGTITMMYIDGSGLTNFPMPLYVGSDLDWSSDGTKLVFSATEHGSSARAIYTINANGTERTKINNTIGGQSPSWSPNGAQITFSSYPSTGGLNSDVYVINVDGTGLVKLTSNPTEDSDPDWQIQQPNATPLPPTYSISGRLTNSTNGGGIYTPVNLTGTITRSVYTDLNGNFSFYGLPAGGDYTITPSTTAYTFTPANRVYNNLNADQTNADFIGTYIPVNITGRITDQAGDPLANVEVISRNGYPEGTTQTDANGYYIFPNVQRGRTYYIYPVPSRGYTFEPTSRTLYVQNESQTADFVGKAFFGISVRVSDLKNGVASPISGVTVTLSGAQSATAITGSSGMVNFNNLPAGFRYTVTPSLPGSKFGPSPSITFKLTSDYAFYFHRLPPVIISEFRTRGINGSEDEFIELYNNSDTDITVNSLDVSGGGWALATYGIDGTTPSTVFVIPTGTVIPARGHFLATNTNSVNGPYSLNSYATGDINYTSHVPDNTGIALFATTPPANFGLWSRLDAVGFSTLPTDSPFFEGTALSPIGTLDGEYSLVRKTVMAGGLANTGRPQDTDNNADDFLFISTTGGSFGGSVASVLGAPGPENLSSAIQRNAQLRATLLDPAQSAAASANRRRYRCTDADVPAPCDPNTSPLGYLSIRRTYTNNTGQQVTRLRFRIVDLTTYPEGTGANGLADLRALSRSGSFTATGITQSFTVQGLMLEQPPDQSSGGGFNSSLTAPTVTLQTPLSATAPNNKITVEFLLGIVQTGNFRFFVNVEAAP